MTWALCWILALGCNAGWAVLAAQGNPVAIIFAVLGVIFALAPLAVDP